jgi:hypothetical protein
MLPTLCRVLAALLRQLAGAFDDFGTRLQSGDTDAVQRSVPKAAPITERTDQNAG